MSKGKKMFGILAILVAAMTVSTLALPSLAAPIMDQLRTKDQLKTMDKLQTQDQLRMCIGDCTHLQTMDQTQARDGSCGDCSGVCQGDGVQLRDMPASQVCLGDCSQLRTLSRLQTRSCV